MIYPIAENVIINNLTGLPFPIICVCLPFAVISAIGKVNEEGDTDYLHDPKLSFLSFFILWSF